MIGIIILVLGLVLFIGSMAWDYWWIPRKRYQMGHELFQLRMMNLTSRTGIPDDTTWKYSRVTAILGCIISFVGLYLLQMKCVQNSQFWKLFGALVYIIITVRFIYYELRQKH